MALFDVLMPVKNGAAFLPDAIRSIQSQTIADWRLLVLDHGSTDGTEAIVGSAAQADSRIVRHCFPDAEGLSGLLNRGLSLVEAPFAMRMDADDVCFPDRMALTQLAFDAGREVAVISGQAELIDTGGRKVGDMVAPCAPDALARVMLFRNAVVHPTICFRSTFLVDRGIRYGVSSLHAESSAALEMPSLAEDYLLLGEMALGNGLLNLPHKLLRYRLHAHSVSNSKAYEQRLAAVRVSRHLASVLARRAGLPTFDPAPFCSHGQVMTDLRDALDYRQAYRHMCEVLRKSAGAWRTGAAELDWRAVFVDRSPIGIAARAVARLNRCRPDSWERRTVVNTVQQSIRRRTRVAVEKLA